MLLAVFGALLVASNATAAGTAWTAPYLAKGGQPVAINEYETRNQLDTPGAANTYDGYGVKIVLAVSFQSYADAGYRYNNQYYYSVGINIATSYADNYYSSGKARSDNHAYAMSVRIVKLDSWTVQNSAVEWRTNAYYNYGGWGVYPDDSSKLTDPYGTQDNLWYSAAKWVVEQAVSKNPKVAALYNGLQWISKFLTLSYKSRYDAWPGQNGARFDFFRSTAIGSSSMMAGTHNMAYWHINAEKPGTYKVGIYVDLALGNCAPYGYDCSVTVGPLYATVGLGLPLGSNGGGSGGTCRPGGPCSQ